jgi:altronate hydrolase
MAEDWVVHLQAQDPVAVARVEIPPAAVLHTAFGEVVVTETVPAGHKVALRAITQGEEVRRYGCRIGFASQAILPGSWVHNHNLTAGPEAAAVDWTVVPAPVFQPSNRTWQGYARPNGQAGTRNYLAVIATVNCAAAVVSQVARHFTPEKLARFPRVDGVVAVVHASGCSLPPEGLSLRHLRRTLQNIAYNPNLGGVLYIGLGCEVNQLSDCQPVFAAGEELPARGLTIQEEGGFQASVAAGIRAVEELLPQVDAAQRTPQPLSKLMVALQCGGSDSWSGVTANPLVGRVADALIQAGGTAVLAETPEIFGAEQLLLERVASPEAGRRLAERVAWWVEHARQRGFSLDNNPSPGNRKGGLTTIYEKSLGAVAKGGSTPLVEVREYAERVSGPGLVFMDTPGNDPISVTGQLAGGCNVILFTTGRGTVYGSTLAPCVKVASNSTLARRMPADMDFNAGLLLEGLNWDTAARDLLDLVVRAAEGQLTCSERNGLPEGEFTTWQIDGYL